MKKIISFFIAVLLVASVLTIGVAAAEVKTQVKGANVNAKAGETVTVNFVIEGNTGFDAANMTVSVAAPLEIVDMTKGLMNNGLINEAYWLINHASAATITDDGVLFSVSVKVADDATAGTYPVNLTVKMIESYSVSLNYEVKAGSITIKGEDPQPPVHQHDYKYVMTVAPTCETEGYELWVCECGDEDYRNIIPNFGHDWQVVDHKDPTCAEDGYTVYVCKNDKSHTYTEIDHATGKHVYMKDGKWNYGFNDTHHWFVCVNCGHTTECEKHDHNQKHDGYWWCECGHRGAKVVVKPSGDYDDVPQTGDITPYVTFGAVALISMAAAAAYVVTRKVAKK